MKPLNARVEPPLESGAPFPFAQQQNAESQLAEGYGIDGLFTLVAPEPFDHLGNGRRLGRLAQHVGVDQIPHSSSVDADSTGNEETFRGAREQPVHHALIRRRQTPRKAVLAAIEPLDLELLAGFDAVLPPDLDRQHNLAL